MNMESLKKTVWKQYAGFFAAAILMGLSVPRAQAIGFLIPNQDAAAIARGNAFVATADNPSAIYYNPAGITQIPGTDFQFGDLNYLGLNMRYIPAGGGQSTHTRFEVIPVPQVYLTKEITGTPLTAGIGVYAPFGLGVKWPEPAPTRDFALESKLTYITVNPVLAWKILPSLSIAAGPTFNYGQIKFTRGLSPVSTTDYFRFIGDDFSYGMTAGILWHPVEKWSFGASYRMQSTMNFSGHSSYTSVEGVGGGAYVPTTASVPFPTIISGGVSFRPTPKWNIEVDVDYINWDTLNTVTLKGTKPVFGIDLPLQLDWHDSWQYKIGVTRSFEGGWYVSAGYFFTTDTSSNNHFTPGVPDTDLHVPSVGFGRNCDHWHWAVAAQLIVGPQRVITSSDSAPPGKYQLISPTLSFSVGYKF